ncbi:MAG: hypothetical protein JRN21_03605 [Nitrososphaerota archaeon]|nr:hypothetical protein [Nitrososphaerota archaeon]
MPYYIYRVSGVKTVKSWRALVSSVSSDTSDYGPVLQGFFAGEGNVRESAHHSRLVRIAQGEPYPLLETILRHFGISFKYGGHREYSISGRDNFEKILALGAAHLHRSKHKKLLRMMERYRQHHYPYHALHALVLARLSTPRTAEDLAIDLKRSTSRLRQVLCDLRSKGDIKMYHVNSTYFCVRATSGVVAISKQKARILALMEALHRPFELSAELKRNRKAVTRRLRELEHIGLVYLEKANWHKSPTTSRVIVR